MSTYRASGVDTGSGDRLVEAIADDVMSTWSDGVIGGFGGFAGGFMIPDEYDSPVLMMTTDGVGTKAELAVQAGRFEGVGYDLVAMIVDDLAAVGARALAVTDYLAVGLIDPERERTIVASIAAACREVGCALIGGETAQHPGVMGPEQFDLAGAAVGVVELGSEVTGAGIEAGDLLIGLASPNLRANGFSLIRSAVLPTLDLGELFPGSEQSVASVLLEPSVLYAPAVLEVHQGGGVRGMVHVTGGGIAGNLVRVLPEKRRARVDLGSWRPPDVFVTVAEAGAITQAEMLATFNMGVGFVLVVDPSQSDAAISALTSSGHDAWVMGEIIEEARGVDLVGDGS